MSHSHKSERPFLVAAQLPALVMLGSLLGLMLLFAALLLLFPDPAPLCAPAAFAALLVSGAVGGLAARRLTAPALGALIAAGEVVLLLAAAALCVGALLPSGAAGYAVLLFAAFLGSLLPKRSPHRRRL